jgi:hypothetical protein
MCRRRRIMNMYFILAIQFEGKADSATFDNLITPKTQQ